VRCSKGLAVLSTLWNLFLAGAAVAVAAGFQAGMIAPGDAFFLAVAIILVFTGQQIIAREDMGLYAATHSILAQPQSYRSRFGYIAYVACLAVGALITVQVAALAVA
jgi:hypothetical protein